MFKLDSISKKEWFHKIKLDLKGKDISNLMWKYDENITIDPFTHLEDLQGTENPLLCKDNKNEWLVGANFNFPTEKLTNEKINYYLNIGLQYFQIDIRNDWNLDELLEGVHLDMISICFNISQIDDYTLFLSKLKKHINVNFDENKLNISFNWIGNENDKIVFEKLSVDVLEESKYIQIKSNDENNPIKELAKLLSEAFYYLRLNSSNVNRMVFQIEIDSTILFEISKIRAFKKLWRNLLSNIGIPYVRPIINISSKESEFEDPNDDLIMKSVQTMIASISGVDSIMFSNFSEKSDEFYNRIAMNIQYVLKLESKIDQVIDPVSGSYHFESLTTKLADKAWKRFINA